MVIPWDPNPKKNYQLNKSRFGNYLAPFQWLFLVPVKGGREHITPQKAIYKWYILPIAGLYATYHPLQEPEKSIDIWHPLEGLGTWLCLVLMKSRGCTDILGFLLGSGAFLPGVPYDDLHEDDHGPEAKSSIMTVCTSDLRKK